MNSLCARIRTLGSTAFALIGLTAVFMFAGIGIPAQAQTVPVAFPSPTTFDLDCINCGFNPINGIASGDFNGDGKLDVVAAIDFQGVGNQLGVALGNGDGTFQAPIVITAPLVNSFFYACAVGDFNKDGLLDVAVWGTDFTTSEVSIFLGTGTGSFNYSNTYVAANSNTFNPGANSVFAADLNGDGKLDVVALTPNNGVFVFLGNGDGTLQTAANYSVMVGAGTPLGMTVGDVNGDGKPDLAVSGYEGMSVLLNSGTGTFPTFTYYYSTVTAGFSNPGIAIGDINGDKLPDIVSANGGAVDVYLNQGSGTFAVGANFLVPSGTYLLSLVDINGDKKLDIVSSDSTGNIFTFLGKGNGTFANGPAYPLQANIPPTNLIVADFNRDGALDLLEQDASEAVSTAVLGRNDGTFQTNQLYGWGRTGSGVNIATADFNGDGIPDVTYSWAFPPSANSDFAVMLGSSHGALGAPTYTTAGSCTSNYVEWVATGDVNGDGKADIVATLRASVNTGCQSNKVAVLFGKGTGKFGTPVYYSTGTTAQEYEAYLTDVNGDGKMDIVTNNADGTVSVLLNKGKGTFGSPSLITSIAALNPARNALTIADFNGDNKMDIAVATYDVQSAVYTLLGNGNGTFGAPITTITSYFTNTAAAADFNKDGKMDLLVTTNGGGCNFSDDRGYAFLKGNGDGTFTPGAVNCTNGAFSSYPVVADFNNDGNMDALIAYGASVSSGCCDWGATVLQGKGDGTFTQLPGPFYSGADNWEAVVADFNGDGMMDVAINNNDSQAVNFVTVMQNSSQPVSVSPLTVNYGTVTVAAKKAETVILTNDQKKTLPITSITLGGTDAGDFSETSNCGTSRKAGWDCTITVTFTPTVTGARTATLSILDAVGTQTVQLNGTGK
jgi:hypothetical protein